MKNWLSIVVVVYLIAMILYGHYRGFIRQAVSLVALAVTLLLVNITMPHVTSLIKENTSIHQSIQQGMKKAAGMDELDSGQDKEVDPMPAVQREMIEGLNLPQQLKDYLIENNNHEVYQLLGVDAFTDYVGSLLADIIVNVIGFILTFIIVYILIHLVMRWLDLIARLPILSGMNKVAGALVGAVESLLFLWVAFLVITACSGTPWGMVVISQIEGSPWLSYLYQNNILNIFIMGVIKGIF